MNKHTIINRYIFLELFPPFLLNILFFTFVFLLAKILEVTNLVVNYRISLGKIILFLFFSMPFFMTFVLPMSVMMAVLLTFLRLSSDNEIIALKATGVSLYQLTPPVLVFCLLGFLMTGFMTMYGMPWGQTSTERVIQSVVASNLNIVLKPGKFNKISDGIMLFVNKVDLKNDILNDLLIEDQRDRKMSGTIIAHTGKLVVDREKASTYLQLYDGMINQVNLDNKSVNSIDFKTYQLTLPIKKAESNKNEESKDEKWMSVKELWTAIKEEKTKDTQYYKYRIEFQNKFSIPFACFTLGILAMSLGIQSRAHQKSYGLGLALTFLLIFYILLLMGWVLGKTGYYPPEVGIWVPNIVIGTLAIVFFVNTTHEEPINILQFFGKYRKDKLRKNQL